MTQFSVVRPPLQALALLYVAFMGLSAGVKSEDVFPLMLEVPIRDDTHGGVGYLYDWAVASESIEKVEIFV